MTLTLIIKASLPSYEGNNKVTGSRMGFYRLIFTTGLPVTFFFIFSSYLGT